MNPPSVDGNAADGPADQKPRIGLHEYAAAGLQPAAAATPSAAPATPVAA